MAISVLPKAITAVSHNCQVYKSLRQGVYWGKSINFSEFHVVYEKKKDIISFWKWFPAGDDSVPQGHWAMSGDIWLSKYGGGWGRPLVSSRK